MGQPKSNIVLPFFILIIFSVTFLSIGASYSCNLNDKNTLLRVKSHLGNPHSLSSWAPETNCCDKWAGVKCSPDGHIDTLTITDDIQVRGTIPSFIGELTSLTQLFFTDVPNLSGTIPPSIGKLTNLNQLWISKTKVSGPIPNFLAQLKDLNGLVLCNQHTGPIPQFIGQFKNLVLLFLSSNKLTGPIPNNMGQLKELAFLDLSNNKFTGPIPMGLAQLPKLNSLNISSNSLSGPIPNFMGQYPSLTTLSLSHNRLVGPIPESFGRAKLTFLELNHNKLTGDGSFLFSKENIGPGEIKINNNLLKFDFSNVETPPLLWAFDISHNMIYGSLPKWVGEFKPNMDFTKSDFLSSMFSYSFDVSYNQLCGPIPNGQMFKNASIFGHNKCLCGGPLPACK